MNRKQIREAIFKLVFERCVSGEFNDDTFAELITDENREYAGQIVKGIEKDFEFLKYAISKYAQDFSYERIYKTDLSILKLAIYEILFTQTPDSVAANEAVELAKTFSADKSPAFINGILAAIIFNKEGLLQIYEEGNYER